MHVSWARAAGIAIVTVLVSAGPAGAGEHAQPDRRFASNDRPDSAVAAFGSHCADVEPAHLECFSSAQARDRAVAAAIREQPQLTAAGGYVVAYVDISFGGASVVLSQDYADLATIGWSNRISSYKVYVNATGRFYDDRYFSGSAQSYCCFSNVSYVGNAYNDKFSSFTIP